MDADEMAAFLAQTDSVGEARLSAEVRALASDNLPPVREVRPVVNMSVFAKEAWRDGYQTAVDAMREVIGVVPLVDDVPAQFALAVAGTVEALKP